ncbi:MAG TPA: hypothetical protein VFL91_10965 [Thermomicrobiales bacterium]|nr:hypothetical protein [Thermomicrobiales bacterium]
MTAWTPATWLQASDESLDDFFLLRLSSLVARLSTVSGVEERTTLAHAIFSTYLDCLDLGLEDEARAILHHETVRQ